MSHQQTVNRPKSPADLAIAVSNGRWWLVPHLELLNQALVFLEQRQAPVWFIRKLGYEVDGLNDDLVPFTRLIVEMPPRHGKSELVSRYFPAWYLGMHPEHHVILTSYEANFARSWGRKARDILKEHGQRLFNVLIKRDSEAQNDWEIDGTDGGMLTTGVGGPITGRGANCFISDDAVKNAEEAASEAIQDRNADWWDSTAYTRIEPDGIAVVMATRWHEKDLTGHILSVQDQEEGDKDGDTEDEFWYVLKLPAIAELGDQLGRQPGEALWPERYPLSRLRRIAARIGSYFFGALYQQRPGSVEGNVFKRSWWQFYDVMPPSIQGYILVDTAHDEKTSSDYSVLAPVRRVAKNLYWDRDFRRGRWEFPELLNHVRDMCKSLSLPALIEETPGSKPLIQTLQRDPEVTVIPFKIGGHSKEARAQAVSPFAEAGNFYLPNGAAWVQDFIEEHAAFPKGAHDDQVDTTSMGALKMLTGAVLPQAVGGRPRPLAGAQRQGSLSAWPGVRTG